VLTDMQQAGCSAMGKEKANARHRVCQHSAEGRAKCLDDGLVICSRRATRRLLRSLRALLCEPGLQCMLLRGVVREQGLHVQLLRSKTLGEGTCIVPRTREGGQMRQIQQVTTPRWDVAC